MDQNIYLFMIIALGILAVADLVVGVSNDAVNFLNSAIGSKAISFKTIMIVASVGIAFGAISSSGMMEVARNGIFKPSEFVFSEIMVIFMAVMVTDILLLDFFNKLGMPTSTTVSIVFELLGAAVAVSALKIIKNNEPLIEIANHINTDKAIEIIMGILISVVVAFSIGAMVQFISRLLLTFNFDEKPKVYSSLFGGLAISGIIYFIVVKGLKSANLFNGFLTEYVTDNQIGFLLLNFIFWSLVSLVLTSFFKINVYRIIIVMGTFALAMAFAGNDLVNFIGVPLAALESYTSWSISGVSPEMYTMEGLSKTVKTPTLLLLLSGVVMIATLWFSSSAKNVIKTSVDLSRQSEGDERFNPNFLSRIIVKFVIILTDTVNSLVPQAVQKNIDKRFHKPYVYVPKSMTQNLPAFDLVRASVNLMVASVLISMATSMKLPLSTTYVTFMVAMGSSLADRAWGSESAVYRVAGVLNVIGGWFFTAFIAFSAASIITIIIFYSGIYGVVMLLIFAFLIIGKSLITNAKKRDVSILEEKLEKAESNSIQAVIDESAKNITTAINCANKIYTQSLGGLSTYDIATIKKGKKGIGKLNNEVDELNDNLFYFIKNLEDPTNSTSYFYITILSYLQNITQSLDNIAKASHKHVNNNHKKLRFNQVRDLIETKVLITNLFMQIKDIFESKNYTALTTLIVHKQVLFKKIDDKIQKQIARTKDDESSPKNTALYFTLLLKTKDLLGATMHLLEAYDQHANKKTNLPK